MMREGILSGKYVHDNDALAYASQNHMSHSALHDGMFTFKIMGYRHAGDFGNSLKQQEAMLITLCVQHVSLLLTKSVDGGFHRDY